MNQQIPVPAKIGAASNIGERPYKVERFYMIERTNNDYPPNHLVLMFVQTEHGKEVFLAEVIEQNLHTTQLYVTFDLYPVHSSERVHEREVNS